MANRFDYRGGEHDAWLATRQEDVIDPDLPIVDAHHHLWKQGEAPYLLREFAHDLDSGHRIVATVFAECHSMYRPDGPEAQRPVGEMVFVAGIGAMSDAGTFGHTGVCRAAVGTADLTLGDRVEPVLDALAIAGDGRFRGVRASICWDPSPSLHRAVPDAGYLARADVRAALRMLAARGHSLDCWLYHPQLPDLIAAADANPDLVIILNHTGTPILGGPYRDQLDDVRRNWFSDMTELARRPNVFVKLGALPAKFRPAGSTDHSPPDSATVAGAWQPWITPCIELFGASRCLFESNFPVHKNWVSYSVLWNAFKRIAAGASASEKADLFAGSAARAYRLTY